MGTPPAPSAKMFCRALRRCRLQRLFHNSWRKKLPRSMRFCQLSSRFSPSAIILPGRRGGSKRLRPCWPISRRRQAMLPPPAGLKRRSPNPWLQASRPRCEHCSMRTLMRARSRLPPASQPNPTLPPPPPQVRSVQEWRPALPRRRKPARPNRSRTMESSSAAAPKTLTTVPEPSRSIRPRSTG